MKMKELMKKAIKLIVLLIAFIYIVSPIDLLPSNPLDDIIVGIIAFMLVFGEFDLAEKLFSARELKKNLK